MCPIDNIKRKHDNNADQEKLRQALVDFRHLKEEELTFVRRAAGLSAAAVIAAFTWPVLERTYWVTSMLWHWSLTSSIFSLISTAEDRLLAELPNETPDYRAKRVENKDDVEAILPLVLGDLMLWVWQTPIMLMSYAWALFLMGYFVLILAPLFDGHDVELTPIVSVYLKTAIDDHSADFDVLDGWNYGGGVLPIFSPLRDVRLGHHEKSWEIAQI